MCPPQAVCVPKYGQKLTTLVDTWSVGNFRGRADVAAENAELGILGAFLCCRFSKKVGFGERRMGLSGLCRGELEVLTEQKERIS